MDWVGQRAGGEHYPLGRAGREPAERDIERFPQLRAATEVADLQQRMERLDENFVVGIRWVFERVDRPHQHLVGGVDVAVRVEQVIGMRNGTSQPACMLRIRAACRVEKGSDVVHVSGDGLAEVRGFGEAAGPVGARRAELGSAQQFADGAH